MKLKENRIKTIEVLREACAQKKGRDALAAQKAISKTDFEVDQVTKPHRKVFY